MKLALGRLGSAGNRTLIQRAIASLRARGSDAHLWLPNTSNYLESTGQTVTTVGNPAGLVLDSLGSVSTLSTTGWVKSVGDGVVTVVGNTITITGATTTTRVNPVSSRTMRAGLTKVTALYTGSAVSPLIYSAGTPVAPASGISATSLSQSTNSSLDCVQIGSGDAVFVIQEYTEITGIHLSQATTANKPILQKTDSKYSWAFDGSNDSLALGSVPFQMGDDFAMVVGSVSDSTAAMSNHLLCLAGASAELCYIAKLSATQHRFLLKDTSGSVNYIDANTVGNSVPCVVSAVKRGATLYLRLNGVQVGSTAFTLGVASLTSACVGKDGLLSYYYLTGKCSTVNAIKGTVTDADLLLYERLIAALTPNGPVF